MILCGLEFFRCKDCLHVKHVVKNRAQHSILNTCPFSGIIGKSFLDISVSGKAEV